ncbi:hypothetical protein BC936DRAFT_137943 [Jimgerdemannia flammicorona]|uniref:Secreted protein n=1 Tax=Jimgerdemannia flammicorona TaxID=994334 RepID=A0A433CW59_9FUNG|nr:hypothetical protein BC936DRAFT_137943 [Jimgerdemannia flammicorona]
MFKKRNWLWLLFLATFIMLLLARAARAEDEVPDDDEDDEDDPPYTWEPPKAGIKREITRKLSLCSHRLSCSSANADIARQKSRELNVIKKPVYSVD